MYMNRKFILLILTLMTILSVNVIAQKTETLALSKKVVTALKMKDMKTLSTYVHPTKGVRFSPYSFVDKDKDRVFSKSQISGLFAIKRQYVWGEYDGSGKPIKKTFRNYFSEFIYDRDFARAKKISYENQIGAGNTGFNLKEIYPSSKFVEFHYPNSKGGDAMDWSSLLLVFEKGGNKWYLVGIIHNQATV